MGRRTWCYRQGWQGSCSCLAPFLGLLPVQLPDLLAQTCQLAPALHSFCGQAPAMQVSRGSQTAAPSRSEHDSLYRHLPAVMGKASRVCHAAVWKLPVPYALLHAQVRPFPPSPAQLISPAGLFSSPQLNPPQLNPGTAAPPALPSSVSASSLCSPVWGTEARGGHPPQLAGGGKQGQPAPQSMCVLRPGHTCSTQGRTQLGAGHMHSQKGRGSAGSASSQAPGGSRGISFCWSQSKLLASCAAPLPLPWGFALDFSPCLAALPRRRPCASMQGHARCSGRRLCQGQGRGTTLTG